MSEPTAEEIKDTVRARYGAAAQQAQEGARAGCCGGGCAAEGATDPITADLYSDAERNCLPPAAMLASLGCGNPTALAELKPGEVVLDLGSGGGIDVLLSARRVGPTGKAYGLDMTDQMLALARDNQQKAGATNVEFLKGDIEHIPLPDATVDVIISNCVVNLAADKRRVLQEAFRVLKPGGRFAVSDVVVRGDVPAAVRRSMELWVGCIAGALGEGEFLALLAEVGFEEASIEPTRIYQFEDARAFLEAAGLGNEVLAREVGGRVMGAFVRATKPAAKAAPVLEVFDPAMCCSSGVCGPEPDPVLPRFAADLEWLRQQGLTVIRYNLAQEPEAFATNPVVRDALVAAGAARLPFLLLDGRLVGQAAYPTRAELAGLVGRSATTDGITARRGLPLLHGTG